MTSASCIDQSETIHRDSITAVLLVGFRSEEAAEIAAALAQANWRADFTQDCNDALNRCSGSYFDFILVDFDHTDIYGPLFISKVRNSGGTSATTAIAATGNNIWPGFRDQLATSGVSHVSPRTIIAADLIQNLAEAAIINLRQRHENLR